MIVSPDKNLRVDPVVANFLQHLESRIPIVPITRLENYEFNPELLSLDKYIVVDFIEYGWDWDMKTTHLFGKNTPAFSSLFNSDEWTKLYYFIKDREPVMYFKRELLQRDMRQNIRPIEYPGLNPIPPIVSKEEFTKRELQVFNAWGLSHERRKDIHGDIWKLAGKYGYTVCDNMSFLPTFLQQESNQKKWLTQNTPWYARYEMKDVLEVSGMSKISCSWAGAGRKCFRHTETINSTMIMWEDNIDWTWPWLDNINCIKCEEGKEVERIVEALENPYLYEIYRAGIATQEKYYLPNYLQFYLQPLINSL